MVNPFDLRGPQFLLFYLALGALVALAVSWMRRNSEALASTPRPLHDYLDIAFLRGGAAEALRVALLTLIDRGLLRIVNDKDIEAVDERAARLVSKATERRILERCQTASDAVTVLSDPTLAVTVTTECEPGLVGQGLLPGETQRTYRRSLLMAAAGGLLAVAAVKIAVALSRGRSNVALLVVEAIVFVIVVYVVTHPRQTAAGRSLLADMRTLFSGLNSSVPSGQAGGGNDFALLAAVFGVSAALPHHPEARALFPPRASTSSDGSSSSTSSSTSSGSSCGSSCGGGGGGCGGCGS